jgi:hypothetical protein
MFSEVVYLIVSTELLKTVSNKQILLNIRCIYRIHRITIIANQQFKAKKERKFKLLVHLGKVHWTKEYETWMDRNINY